MVLGLSNIEKKVREGAEDMKEKTELMKREIRENSEELREEIN